MSKERFARYISIKNTYLKFSATKEDKHQSLGFPNSAYGMSKVSLTAASFVQQRILQADKSRPDIVVNACCPGKFLLYDTELASGF